MYTLKPLYLYSNNNELPHFVSDFTSILFDVLNGINCKFADIRLQTLKHKISSGLPNKPECC